VGAVGLILNETRALAAVLARDCADWLVAGGHEVRLNEADARASGLDEYACPPEKLVDDLDLVVSLGGDGTMLRAVQAVAPLGIPVLGVNVGRLGYLAGVEPPELNTALGRYFEGDYSIEERMMLAIEVHENSGELESSTYLALNEAVVEKPAAGHTVRMSVELNERLFTSYAADGVIVATPTGSTAYSFSAGGPIVSSRHRAILITPVSPHMAFDRSLVIDPSEVVRVTVVEDRPAMLTVDGRSLDTLAPGDAVTCTESAHCARFVTFDTRDFYRILKAKFGLAEG